MYVNREDEMPVRVLLGGRPHWLWSNGRLMPVISGGDDPDPDDDDDDDDDGNKPPEQGRIDDAQFHKLQRRFRKEGMAKGREALAKELGFDDVEGLKSTLTESQAAADKQKSEDEKARDQLAKDRKAVDEERTQAKTERFNLRCERALIRAGCPEGVVEDAVKLMKLDGKDDLEAEDFKDAAEDLKERVPGLFTEKESSGDPKDDKNPDSDPGKPGGRKQSEKTAAEQAKEIFDRRHPKPVKQDA